MDLSSCYLHTLGPLQTQKLAELRGRLPEVVQTARQGSTEVAAVPAGKLTMWRVPLEEQSDASDIVLLKYLRAEELNVENAAKRLANTLIFRADCKIDELAEAELPEHFQGHDFIPGVDAEGRPVMISKFGTMDIDKVFGDLEAFVRYRTKLMENAIALLRFERGAAEDLCQIHDYSGVMGSMYKSSVKSGVTAVSKVFAEHYPEFKGKTLFLNFPAVFSRPFQALAALLPERTRKKFIILGQDDHMTLFQHLGPELVPEVLGGLLRSPPGPLKGPGHIAVANARDAVDVVVLQVAEPGAVAWELRVCTLEVSYEVAFVTTDGSEEIVARSEVGKYLTATDGVVSGTWQAKVAGTVKVRFRNECAWFKKRLCLCRAALVG